MMGKNHIHIKIEKINKGKKRKREKMETIMDNLEQMDKMLNKLNTMDIKLEQNLKRISKVEIENHKLKVKARE